MNIDPKLDRLPPNHPFRQMRERREAWKQTPEYIASQDAARVDSLWKAATAYEQSFISGSAGSMLTVGYIKELPKCLAVKNWISSIWNLYYERKLSGSADTNFSIVGPIPYSVPELRQETGM